MQTHSLGNILRVVPLTLTTSGFTDESGFFIRVETAGYLKYCPMNNVDSEYIIKYFEASNIFIDPELCRKIFPLFPITSPPSGADDIFIGYGV